MKKLLPLAVTAAAVAYYAYYKLVELSSKPEEKNNISNIDFDLKEESINKETNEKDVCFNNEENIETIVQPVTLKEIEVGSVVEETRDDSLTTSIENETVVQPVTLNEIEVKPELSSVVESVEETNSSIELEQFDLEDHKNEYFDPDPVIETVFDPINVDDDYIPKSEAEAFITNFEPEINRFRTIEKEPVKEKLTVSVASNEKINQKEVEELIEKIKPIDINESTKIEEIVVKDETEDNNELTSLKPEIKENNIDAIIDINNIESETVEKTDLVFEPEISLDSLALEIMDSKINQESIDVKDKEDSKEIDIEEAIEKLQVTNEENVEEIVSDENSPYFEPLEDQQRRILELQVDLQLADFDDGSYLVTQKVSYNDEKLFNLFVSEIYNYGYQVDENDKHERFISRKVTGKEKAKSCILSIYDRVKEDNQLYEHFKIRMAK